MTVQELKTTEYGTYYKTYLDMVPSNMDLIEAYYLGETNVLSFFKSLPADKLEYSYEEHKWTVKEIFQHIIDTERIFMYRCLRIARHDRTPLSGFEQNDYIEPSKANNKSLEALLEEYKIVRQNSIVLLKSLNDTDFKFTGNASGNNLSARAAAFIVLGHELWHIKIIKERYL